MKKKIFASSVSRSTSGRSGSLSRGLLSDFPSAARVRWTAGRAVALALVLSVATVLVMLSISSHRRDSGEKRHWKDYEYVMSVGRATEVRATSAGHEAGWAPCARAGNQHSFAFVAAEADGDGDEGRRSRERCSLGSKFGHTAHMEAPDATGRLGFRNHEARVNGSTKLLGKWALARSLPYDEFALLSANLDYMKRATGLDKVEVLEAPKAEGAPGSVAVPGVPDVQFETEPVVAK